MKKQNNRNNFFILNKENYTKTNNVNIAKVVKILNDDKLLILSGLKNTGKVNFLKELLYKTNIISNYFYFNKAYDTENYIKNSSNLNELLKEYINLYSKPKLIILNNIADIEGIKDFVTKIYKSKFKIIIIGNNIKINGIHEVEIKNQVSLSNKNYLVKIKYGLIREIDEINNLALKEKFLKCITSDILLNSIYSDFSVKNTFLYNYTIAFIAKNNIFLSLRDIQKNISNIVSISLKTVIDYIDFSLQAKIIKKVYKYDLKTNQIISSKAYYYFTDNGIRNSLYNFNLTKDILIKNTIFNILDYNNYKIYSGLNGKFSFTFYGEKKDKKIYIQIFNEKGKDNINKQVNKLLKIGNKHNKYLLVTDLSMLNITKTKFDNVLIIEISNFLINFK